MISDTRCVPIMRVSTTRRWLALQMTTWWLCAVFVLELVCTGGQTSRADRASERLPRTHAYQQELVRYLATLTEADFAHGVTALPDATAAVSNDPEYLYRTYLSTLMIQPLVGTKRGVPAVNAPPACFLLANTERDDGVYMAPVWPETLMSFVEWDYPGNPYRGNRALKLRAFVGAAVQLLMFHQFAEANDAKVPPPIRPDWHGYNPVFWAAPYPGFKDVLPPAVQQAFETGMRMVGERILSWGIRGESCEDDLKAPLGMVYISRAVNDPAFTAKVESSVRPVFTDPRHIHPAGYWMERGGPELGFGGAANLYAAWIALLTDWPFAKETLECVYRLRSHLILPEPDGRVTGPSHFNSRLGSPASADQFGWNGARDAAVAMMTDEAAHSVTTPSPETLKRSPILRATAFAEQLRENFRDAQGHYLTNDELNIHNTMSKWSLRMWMSWNFPISLNPAYELYRNWTWARRQEREQRDSPLLKSPFLRRENFIRNFEKTFVVLRQPHFAAILHIGPVGAQQPDDSMAQFPGPMGLGGGQLSAFWMPASGPVILGLRSGMSHDRSFDDITAWRTWPIHAVSGLTGDGKVVTSARMTTPSAMCDIKGNTAKVTVTGQLVGMSIMKDPTSQDPGKAKDLMYDEPTAGRIDYVRTFALDASGVRVETTFSGDGRETVAELYETLPVNLGKGEDQKSKAGVEIEFQTDGVWRPSGEQTTANVLAVRVTRFGASVTITFTKPQRVKLSPAAWEDKWLNAGAACRNVMIDLLNHGGKPTPPKNPQTVVYHIQPATK